MSKKIIIMLLSIVIVVSSFLCFGGMTIDGLDNDVVIYYVDEMGRTLSKNQSFVEAPVLEGYSTNYTLMNKMGVFPSFEIDFTQEYTRISQWGDETGYTKRYQDVISNDIELTKDFYAITDYYAGNGSEMEAMAILAEKYLEKFGKTGFYQVFKYVDTDGSSRENYWGINLFVTPFEVNFGENYEFAHWSTLPSLCDVVLLIDGELYDLSVVPENNSGITLSKDMYSLEGMDMVEEVYGAFMYSFKATNDFVINKSMSIHSIGGVTKDNVKVLSSNNIKDIAAVSNLKDYVFNKRLYVQVSYEKIEELPPVIIPDEDNGPVIDEGDNSPVLDDKTEIKSNNVFKQFFVDIKQWFISLGNDIKKWFVSFGEKIKGLFV